MIRFLPSLARFAPDSGRTDSTAEREWVLRAQQDDGRAFRVLFELHAAAVHRFLRDLLGDPAAADEATQETFVRAHARLRRLRSEERFRPWILGIARNVFREQCRGRKREAPVRLPDGPDDPSGDELLEGGAAQEQDPRTPESALLAREASSQLERALQALTEDRRAALLLRFDHGLSCAEVSEILGWSVAKVKVEVHRARLQVRAQLDRLGEESR